MHINQIAHEEREDRCLMIIKMAISALVGGLVGFYAIHAFNRIPAKWLCDYDEDPRQEMWGVRVKENPWSAVFALVFLGAAMKLFLVGELYVVPGLAALWLLLQIGIADYKYKIIPDQHVIALAAVAIGFVPYHSGYLTILYGALVGGGSMLLMGLFGWVVFRREALGFGDVKLFFSIGLVCGLKGICLIFLLTVFLSAAIFGVLVLIGKIKRNEEQPFGPFISLAAALYLLFPQEINQVADLLFFDVFSR